LNIQALRTYRTALAGAVAYCRVTDALDWAGNSLAGAAGGVLPPPYQRHGVVQVIVGEHARLACSPCNVALH
jgi:hypothetical protein